MSAAPWARPGNYVYLWRFQGKSGREAYFEDISGQTREWVGLFQRAEGYVRTELLKDWKVPAGI